MVGGDEVDVAREGPIPQRLDLVRRAQRRRTLGRRAELGLAVDRLRAEVTEVTDWRKQINKRRKQVLIGAAVAGFVLGGGLAALAGLVSGRDDYDY